MNRRQLFAAIAAVGLTAATGAATRVRYTTAQLIAAARLWLRNHHVKGYATVTIIPGDGPPHPDYLDPAAPPDNIWRWSPNNGAWIGPAYNVTWFGTGFPPFTSPVEGARLMLYIGTWTVEGAPALVDLNHSSLVSTWGQIDSTGPTDWTLGNTVSHSTPHSARDGVDAPASGVAFLAQWPFRSPGDTNYVQQPSAEGPINRWAAANSATVAASTDWSMFGTKSFKVTPSTGANNPLTGISDAGGVTFPLYIGTTVATAATHTLSAYFKTAATDLEAQVELNYGSGDYTSAWTPIGSTPTRVSVSGAPTIAVDHMQDATIWVRSAGASRNLTAADVVYIDAVTLTRTNSAGDYYDGASADDGTYAYEWVGDPNNSISTRTLVATPPPPAAPEMPTLDVLTYLGNVTVNSTFTYPPAEVEGVGADGDYYLDTTGKALYGPKDGDWPATPAVSSFKLTQLVR